MIDPNEEILNLARQRSPALGRVLTILFSKNPLQGKQLRTFLPACDQAYWERTETALQMFLGYLQSQSITIEATVDAYLQMCDEVMVEQIYFARTGKYRATSTSEVFADVYSNDKIMGPYMYGLGLSIFLWPNHYRLYDFFLQTIQKLPSVKSYLEIGPGHGLFLWQSLQRFPQASFQAVDISQASINLSREFAEHAQQKGRCSFEVKDVFQMEDTKQYDLLVMCEVLEHVTDVPGILRKLRGLLAPGGKCFLTTCANAPAVDHVYLFNDETDIRQHLEAAGFAILNSVAVPVDNIPQVGFGVGKRGLNYAALLADRATV